MSEQRDYYLPYFEAVQNKMDWRGPICASVKAEDVDVTVDAIMFFTGTEAEVYDWEEGYFLVKSVGYRNGPCGP